ncbi:MAG: alpha/beta hydrolase family protein [Gaiellaceae bacterium]
MSYEKAAIGEIPVLVSRPPASKPAPLLLLSHWFSGSKESWLERLDELSGRRYFVVAMDNRLHGERAGAGFETLMPGGKLDLPNSRRAIHETATDVSALIDHFSLDGAVDSDRIGITGISMGGFVSFAALVNDARIKVATPIIASPYWGDVPADTPVDLDAAAAADLADFARNNEPASRMETIPPRALLMQIGAEDVHYDCGSVELFYEELRPLYGDESERLGLIVQPGIGHECTPEMWANTLAWLEKYL